MTELKIKHVDIDKVSFELEVEIPPSTTQSEYNNALKEIQAEVKMPGFRKGKVPSHLILSKYKEYIEDQCLQKILPKIYQEAVEKKKLTPFGTPTAKEVSKFSLEEPLKVIFLVDKSPSVSIKKYDINIKENEYKLDIEAIYTDEIDRQLRSKATLEKSKSPCTEGDFVRLQITDNQKIGSDLSLKDYPAELKKSTHTVYELYEDILGMKEGDKKTVKKTLSKDYRDTSLQEKKVDLTIEIMDIKNIKRPELTEELAKEMNYNNIEDFKKSCKQGIDSYIDKIKSHDTFEYVIDALKEVSDFALPESVIEISVNYQINHLKQQLGKDEKTFLDYLQSQNMNLEKLKKDIRPKAIEEVKKQLIIEQIIKDKKIEANEDAVKSELQKIAQKQGKEYKDVRKEFIQNGYYEQIRTQVIQDNAIEAVFKKANRVKGKVISNKDIL